MLKRVSTVVFASALLMGAPANAQLGVKLGTDVDLGVNVRVGDPYTYRGYHSGRWYAYEEPHRSGRYYDEYGGYDCYKAFQYTWYDDYRARYDSYWCFDDRGRKYEVSSTRAVVRIR